MGFTKMTLFGKILANVFIPKYFMTLKFHLIEFETKF